MEQLKNNLPIISLGLLILGTVNLMLYYNHFNIDILSYLDFTEILQIQFRLFATAAALIVLLILYITLSQKVSEFLSKRKKAEIETTEKVLAERRRNGKYNKIAFLIFITFTIALNIYSLATTKTYNDNIASSSFLWVMSIGLFGGTISFFYFQIKDVAIKQTPDEDKRKQGLMTLKYICGFIILTYASGVFARLSAEDALSYRSSYEATVMMEKKTFATNKDYRYLGRTKNFTFFYDILKKQAEVFPNSDIKNTFIRDGVDYRTPEQKKGITVTFRFDIIVDWFKRLRN